MKSAITLFAGLSAGLNACLDFLIYVIKHEEIKRCALKTLIDFCPSMRSAVSITINGTTAGPMSKM